MHIYKACYMSLYIKLSPTSLLQNHMGSLVRMQTQGLAAGLLNQSPCEQNLEIYIFNILPQVMLVFIPVWEVLMKSMVLKVWCLD